MLQRAGDAPGREVPTEPGVKPPREVLEFAKAAGAALPEGKYVQFGARVFLAPEELPVGILTAVIGGPIFIIMLKKNNREKK